MLPWACKVPLSLKGKLFALISSPPSSHRSPSRHKPCEDKGAGEKATCPNLPEDERFGAHTCNISQVTSTLCLHHAHVATCTSPDTHPCPLALQPEQPNQSQAQAQQPKPSALLTDHYLTRFTCAELCQLSSALFPQRNAAEVVRLFLYLETRCEDQWLCYSCSQPTRSQNCSRSTRGHQDREKSSSRFLQGAEVAQKLILHPQRAAP